VGQFFLGLNALLGVLGKMGIVTTGLGPKILAGLGNPITIIVAAILLLILLIPRARKAFFTMLGWLVGALVDVGKTMNAVFQGDWEIAMLYGKRALLGLLAACQSFAEMVLQLFLGVGEKLLDIFNMTFLPILKLMDKLTGSNYVAIYQEGTKDLFDIAKRGVGDFFDTESTKRMQEEIDEQIQVLKAAREAALGPKQETPKEEDSSVLDENLKINEVKSLMDEMKKQNVSVETQAPVQGESLEELKATIEGTNTSVTNLTQNFYGVREEEIMNETKKYI
jgi:hypothetical protein